MKFGERKGYKKISDVVQIKGMNDDLRASLWSALYLLKWNTERKDYFEISMFFDDMSKYSAALWFGHFKKPADERSRDPYDILQAVRDYFFQCQWYEVYDFLEFTLNYYQDESLNETINAILERELSGYRFISGMFTDITNSEEIAMLESALSDNDYPAVKAHLQRALELLSNREQPDYRNSIKESISAVESLAKVLSGSSKATLGDALKVIEKKGKIHPSLKEAFLKLYGYASDEGGIRHAMLDEPNVTAADAKF
ncbi:MAG TPA: hypothetical protein VFL17_13795 [Anaerolineae bacterium]|nr:hypothetical protein [Anaerolineae bacterium]